MLIRLKVLLISLTHLRSLAKSRRALLYLDSLSKKYAGALPSTKGFRANGRYFMYNHVPGFPSKAFNTFHREELNLIEPFSEQSKKLRSVVLSITKKCPLSCEHCYEIELLNKKEVLSIENLKTIVLQLQQEGVTQIYLSGGEPLARFNDLLEILSTAQEGTDFWLITSGTQLSPERACQLKQTGRLTGVSISLDHFLREQHNAFRKRTYSYDDALAAAKNCREAGLAVGLAVCTTRSFTSWKNLMCYAELAKKVGAHFIQLQEPFAVGGYSNKDVLLRPEEVRVLDSFYKELNHNKKYKDFPMVVFHGYHQRRIGCFGGGNRYLYIDSDGFIHSCPYCRNKAANLLENTLSECIQSLESKGCVNFSSN